MPRWRGIRNGDRTASRAGRRTFQEARMGSYLFTGGRFLDPRLDELRDGIEILVEDTLIKEVSDCPIAAPNANRIDIGNRTLMPGLIDAHIHVVLTEVNL